MSRVPGVVFRLTRCRLCGAESKGDPAPTLSPGLVIAYCTGCKKRGPAEDLGPATVEALPRRQVPTVSVNLGTGEVTPECAVEGCPDPPEPGSVLCAPHLVDDEAGMAEVAAEAEDRITAAYREWRATPDGAAVYARVRRRALELRRRGFRRYGIQALAEVVRFDRSLEVGPDRDGYKVNNTHLSRMARELMEEPELRGFFETRVLHHAVGSEEEA